MVDWYQTQILLFSFGGLVPALSTTCLSFLALYACGTWRRATVLATTLAIAFSIGVATKFAFHKWGAIHLVTEFRGASGHALNAAAVYPPFAWILSAGLSPRRKATAVAAGIFVACMVTIAAMVSGIHTPAEALVGALVGSLVPISMASTGRIQGLPGRSRSLIFVCAIALWTFVAIHQEKFDAVDDKFFRMFALTQEKSGQI
jgi:hypothetical protein